MWIGRLRGLYLNGGKPLGRCLGGGRGGYSSRVSAGLDGIPRDRALAGASGKFTSSTVLGLAPSSLMRPNPGVHALWRQLSGCSTMHSLRHVARQASCSRSGVIILTVSGGDQSQTMDAVVSL